MIGFQAWVALLNVVLATHTSIKVKFTLEQAIKTQRESKSIDLLFL